MPALRQLLMVLLLTTATLPAIAGRLDPHTAAYELYRGGSTLGEAEVRLRSGDAPGCFVYSYTATPSWLFRWATGELTEVSEFCTDQGRLIPHFYRYHRDGIGAGDENFKLHFDNEKGIVTDHKGDERQLPAGAVDRLLVQLEALRLVEGMGFPVEKRVLTVTVVDDDRIKDYTLAVMAEETIKVPAGKFRTIRIERIKDKKKTTRFWVAPELDNLLVKVEQQRKDDPVIGLALKRLPEMDGDG